MNRFKQRIGFFLLLTILIVYNSVNGKNKASEWFDDHIEPNSQQNGDIERHFSRNLLSIKLQKEHKFQNCVRPDIEEFPKGFTTQSQRRNGLIIFHFLIAFYMFVGLAIVCDEYFVPSLDMMCKMFSLKQDVAGATLMAAGSSAPELATTIISLFIAEDVDIGIGTVVGSAVFNIMFVVSIVALMSGMIICLNWFPIIRDSFFYLLSVLAMILVIMDDKVYWYEAVIFLILYGVYILALVFNSKIESYVCSHMTLISKTGLLDSAQLDSNNYNTLKNEMNAQIENCNSSSTITLGDNTDVLSNKDENERNNFDLDNSSNETFFSPFTLPSKDQSTVQKIKYFVCWPLFLILYVTVPDSRKPDWHKYFVFTFIMSLVWLSVFSYIMVWMITIIGYTFLIPDTVMGITLISFGASVPDALSSLLVAKNGFGDMAISNAIGSNVFDILICLGIPWLIRCLTIEKVSYITVKSRGLTYSTITLFGTVIILVLAIRVNKWQLDKKLGIFLMIVYLCFILLTSLYELNILGSNHLPMCNDSEW